MTTERGKTLKSEAALVKVNGGDGPVFFSFVFSLWSIFLRKAILYYGTFNIGTLIIYQTPLLEG